MGHFGSFYEAVSIGAGGMNRTPGTMHLDL